MSKMSDELKNDLFGGESEHSDQMSEIMELVLDGDMSRSEGLIYAIMQNKDQELIVLKVNYLPVKNVNHLEQKLLAIYRHQRNSN